MGAFIADTDKSLADHGEIVTQVSSSIVTGTYQENRPANVLHDENGKFAKGNPGGPGRPATIAISDAYKTILRRDGPMKYAEVIAKDALESTRARDRLAAISEITDRVEGKATQRTDIRGVFVVLAPEVGNLAALDGWADE